jgi:hypothetical protein
MANDHMTRFEAGLFEAAVDEGLREHRSARQQLEHWTRLGRELSAHETSARRRIEAAVRGETPLASLTAEERLVANVEIDVAIRERAAGTSFGRSLLKAGVTAVGLDEHGVLREFSPDGTSRPVEGHQGTDPRAAQVDALRPG